MPSVHHHSSAPAQICNLLAEQPKDRTATAADGQRDIVDLATLTMQFGNTPVYIVAAESIWNLQVVAAKVQAQRRGRGFPEYSSEFCFWRASDWHPDTGPTEFGNHLPGTLTADYLNERLDQ